MQFPLETPVLIIPRFPIFGWLKAFILPAFPAAFPHFGSAQYWESETRDLEEQVLRLLRDDEAPEGLRRPAEPEPELSNEDLFWDL